MNAFFRRCSTALCLAASGAAGGAAADDMFRPLATDAGALAAFRWEMRPVLLFAPSVRDDRFRAAMAELRAARADLRDRDIVVLLDTDPERQTALRETLDPAGFLMVLVGKDGGIKLRSDRVIPVETLNATIDAMPMRQREMRDD